MIRIRGARQHNLKNIDIDLPKGKLVVITGPSGSGKSSLAFHTLYAEGQRRYVESLSTYARQFLDQLEKPDVDRIEGLSPAIAIDQRGGSGNPRSTVATSTEIYDYLRILWSAIGVPHDPDTGEPLEKMGAEEIVDALVSRQGAKVILLAPIVSEMWDDGLRLLEDLQRQGFIRVRINGEIYDIDSAAESWPDQLTSYEVVVDRLVIREGGEDRLADSVETALRICGAEARALVMAEGADDWEELSFATAYRNPTSGFELPELTPKSFSFNSYAGACPSCHGIGTEVFCDPGLVIPDRSKTLEGHAVAVFKAPGKGKTTWQQKQILSLARHYGVAEDVAVKDLPEEFVDKLLFGTGEEEIAMLWEKEGDSRTFRRPYEGVAVQAERLLLESTSDAVKRKMSGFMASRKCVLCDGKRLRREILAVKVARTGDMADALGVSEFCHLPVTQALEWVGGMELPKGRAEVLERVVGDLQARLGFLENVGLGYLALDRATASLSGGETQRIRLASQLGAGLSGVLYVLDEPSIGLHQEDNDRLIATLKRLRDLGNTVIVVEHDEDMIRQADWVVDIGPAAGENGGEVMGQGTPEELAELDTPTGRWLRKQELPELPKRVSASGEALKVYGATERNLKSVDASIPLHQLVCVTGPSGSGKSTLIDTILRRALQRHLHRSKARPGEHDRIEGMELVDRLVVVDQSSLGASPRSNAATYTGVMDLLRELFVKLPLSRQRGYTAGRFSFNVKGGRCERCQGAGQVKIDMHFLADAWITCDLCDGKRYNRETLDVRYKGHSISDLLAMTISEALTVLAPVPKIRAVLECLRDVGLGYLRLGQPANTLSGGEAQRVRLATELSKGHSGHVLYILDEPTTGLHYWDVMTLLDVLVKLREQGHSLIVIEHNLDIIRAADHIIDLGEGGGAHGGRIVAMGTPGEVAKVGASATGRWLAKGS